MALSLDILLEGLSQDDIVSIVVDEVDSKLRIGRGQEGPRLQHQHISCEIITRSSHMFIIYISGEISLHQYDLKVRQAGAWAVTNSF